MENSFALDKPNAKLMGVCAGLARSTGADPTLVRVLTVVSIFLLGGLTIPVYFVAGLVAPVRP
ncbi:MAG TPA: PspC domain-containing protein [Allosphingosinicella sp.]|jgi:phage shock protein C